MTTRADMLRQFADDMADSRRSGIGPDFDHIENYEASEWLTASDAPADGAVQYLMDWMAGLSDRDSARLHKMLVDLLISPSFDTVIELRDTLRAALMDEARDEIARQFNPDCVAEIRAATIRDRASEMRAACDEALDAAIRGCSLLQKQAG